ncbi:MAG: ribonuclease R [Candidatus Contendobacter odensis]|uniref:Ribonuclease R n=1 Tax=Candidatus Contendibacter odensensis TaxID=1400860 RepID=A0A2G6PDY9_9GAMM|nr:MAG: ribonuclease R [Candidatus Contendobacter odensis]
MITDNIPDASDPSQTILRHPLAFFLRVFRAFRSNKGMLLASAITYHALLSLVPLLILLLLILSHLIDTQNLLDTLRSYLDYLVPGESALVIDQVTQFMDQRKALGWTMAGTLVFFSAAAFSTLESAMEVVFEHRKVVHNRNFITSLFLPYLYVLLLAFGLLAITLFNGSLQALMAIQARLLGWEWLSVTLLYVAGLLSQVAMFTLIYMLMPAGRLPWRHALIGGIAAALLWEGMRYLLVWYFANLSKINAIYGSLAGVMIALMSLYVVSFIILLGAQVIAEYEKLSPDFGEAM